MPRMTGLQVCHSVRAEASIAGTRVMLLSAAVQPFSPRSLTEQIRVLAAGVRSR